MTTSPEAEQREAGSLDSARETLLLQKVIGAISTASVPHPSVYPGALESRSLAYYLSVGIDYFGHDHARHEQLLTRAAEFAIAMVRAESAS